MSQNGSKYTPNHKKSLQVPKTGLHRSCGLQAIKDSASLPLAGIGVQVPAWLAPMTDKQK
jgi:hypothetical protein